jgi:hypothetical protein
MPISLLDEMDNMNERLGKDINKEGKSESKCRCLYLASLIMCRKVLRCLVGTGGRGWMRKINSKIKMRNE